MLGYASSKYQQRAQDLDSFKVTHDNYDALPKDSGAAGPFLNLFPPDSLVYYCIKAKGDLLDYHKIL